MIDISCKNLLTKEWDNILHQFSWGHNQTPKGRSKMQIIIEKKNLGELLMTGVISVVNKYACFTENRNMIRIFCDCKHSQRYI